MQPRPIPSAALCLTLAALLAVPARPDSASPTAELGYQTPPQALVDIVDRPLTPRVRSSPDLRWLLLLEQPSLPTIAELAEPELRLAGLRIKPQNNGPSRQRPATGLELVRVADGEKRAIRGLPEEARLGNVTFSPDGHHIAFTHTRSDAIELWVAEVASGAARRLIDTPLNLAARLRPTWLADSQALICALIPQGRGTVPAAPAVPVGPVVQENLGKKSPARTFQDLLKDTHDEALFEHYLTAQLARVTLAGEVTPLGAPGILWDYDPSPDGSYLLVEILHRPFSYLVPARRFPRRVEVRSPAGELVHLVADLPLQESIPIAFGSVAPGPRSFSWRADADATLVWTEAQDGGDAGRDAEHRDQLFLHAAPFADAARPWVKLQNRFGGVEWGRDDLALVYGWWWKTRNMRVSRARPGAPETAAELLIDRSWEDRYNDPGSPITRPNARGREVLWTADGGESLYLTGNGASPEGDRPFFDVYDLATRTTRRLFRSEAPYYERPVALLDAGGPRLLTRRESVEEPANYFVRDLESQDLRQLTAFPHPTPELAGIQKELIRYQRADGVDLTATLYLPPGPGSARAATTTSPTPRRPRARRGHGRRPKSDRATSAPPTRTRLTGQPRFSQSARKRP